MFGFCLTSIVGGVHKYGCIVYLVEVNGKEDIGLALIFASRYSYNIGGYVEYGVI
jgi:hypothetical protein